MRRLGTVVRTAQGLVILRVPGSDGHTESRANDVSDEIGTSVLGESLEEIGRVVDVFGPVDRPYLAVSPNADVHTPSLVGKPLYAR